MYILVFGVIAFLVWILGYIFGWSRGRAYQEELIRKQQNEMVEEIGKNVLGMQRLVGETIQAYRDRLKSAINGELQGDLQERPSHITDKEWEEYVERRGT